MLRCCKAWHHIAVCQEIEIKYKLLFLFSVQDFLSYVNFGSEKRLPTITTGEDADPDPLSAEA